MMKKKMIRILFLCFFLLCNFICFDCLFEVFRCDIVRDGIDIGDDSESGESEYDSEEDEDDLEDFIDHNLDMYRQSSVPNSGGTFFLLSTYV